jgi:UDP-N-acetylmuramate: L-alanyl-gamma-D-glutamyl-meso-diaminopimelate ligase
VATTGEIVATIAGEAKDGDVVVIMSNGAFDNIHQRLLEALRQAEPAS